ncbi:MULTISPECIES: albusnodin family lasso peptide [Actinomycetes]|uniref:albusnodin family lasso peptide n=1 Tax=Actinomycetes TaxID=1760 RepID=UPI000D0AB8F7|nr:MULTISPECIES: albusnodin family lasso peptide [Actinomycetes]
MENVPENGADRAERGRAVEEPVLLVSLGEVSAATQGLGMGHSEDKRRAYN